MTIILDGTNGITTPGPSVVEANTSDAALRITQTGSGNALLVEDSANPDSTPVVIDANGRLLLGSSTSYQTKYNAVSFTPGFQSYVSVGTGGFYRYSANSDPATLVFSKSRNATIGSQTVVNNSDNIGYIGFAGSDGTNFITAATIIAAVDGTPGTNDMPGRLVFATTADGSATPTERMRIDSSGNLLFNSGYGSVATAYGCRAWVNWNGTGTVAIRASGNVSSITDNGTGNYLMNFTTAMPDTDYCCTMNGRTGGGVQSIITVNRDGSPTTTTNPIYVVNPSTPGILQDEAFCMVAVFR